jgi:ATP-binding cassette subfamily B protein
MAYIKLFKELWRYAAGYRWKVVTFIVLHALANLATLAQPLVFGQILNSFQKQSDQILNTIILWLGVWVGLFIWFNIFHRAANYFCYDVSYRVKQAFLNDYYSTVTRLPLKWHTDHHSGSTINRINTAAEALFNFSINHYQYISFFMLFWGPLVALLFLSWQVSAMAFVIAAISVFVMWQFDKRLVVLYKQMNEIQHKVASVLYDYVSNIKTIITLRLGPSTGTELDHQIEKGYRPYMKSESQVNQWKWLSISFGVLILEAGVIFYYIWQQLARSGTVLVGNIAAVFQYLQLISKTYMDIAVTYHQIMAWRTDFETAEPIKNALKSGIALCGKQDDWNHIQITDLNFEYEPGKETLQNVTLSFAKGNRIALVGESGSGKSSLMAVLRGLYEPDHVNLDIDGQSSATLAPLFEMTTLIPQEPEVFENTIGYNITVGIEYSTEDLMRAVRLACFDRVLERLPNGLDTDVRERGVTLSGGERQRLALARGILAARDSSIILMDEPTSSVDAHNEMTIYENIFSHFKDSTIISSIHRLHLLNKFDQVIVMDQGRIIQVGTFEELKNQPGVFQKLWDKYWQSSKIEEANL